jgi:hypothetical protein
MARESVFTCAKADILKKMTPVDVNNNNFFIENICRRG